MVPLNILHVLRTPVGGLFRHVRDLARGQIARGHRVGIVADSATGGSQADAALAEIAPSLALGVSRTPMRRAPGPADLPAMMHVMRRIAESKADVVHGHGAKGGAYVRMALNAKSAVRVYTPHGGSLHYDPRTLSGRLFLGTEKLLIGRGDVYIFESAYSADVFRQKIGTPKTLSRVVHNGLNEAEFVPVELAPNASDLLFVGELRQLKGVDVLIEAMAILRDRGRRLTATLVGHGPDRAQFETHVARRGLQDAVHLAGALPARQAFTRGKLLVVPSRAESLPYIVLEAAAAGKPLITTRVGGIPEIFGSQAGLLVRSDDAPVLADAILDRLDRAEETARVTATLRQRVAQAFIIDTMVDGVLAAYDNALEARNGGAPAFRQFAALR
jgi:glycosyltransferase involved in cell wall biosynthesis